MTLPSSPPITFAQIQSEYGLSLPMTLPNAIYGKPGFPSSGTITGPGDFLGKSNVSFNPDGGNLGGSGPLNASATATCNLSAVWTYSGGGTGGTVSIASGASSTSIQFNVTAGGSGSSRTDRTVTWSLTGTSNGVTRNFNVSVTAFGNV